jgi:hypothetical protein
MNHLDVPFCARATNRNSSVKLQMKGCHCQWYGECSWATSGRQSWAPSWRRSSAPSWTVHDYEAPTASQQMSPAAGHLLQTRRRPSSLANHGRWPANRGRRRLFCVRWGLGAESWIGRRRLQSGVEGVIWKKKRKYHC